MRLKLFGHFREQLYAILCEKVDVFLWRHHHKDTGYGRVRILYDDIVQILKRRIGHQRSFIKLGVIYEEELFGWLLHQTLLYLALHWRSIRCATFDGNASACEEYFRYIIIKIFF